MQRMKLHVSGVKLDKAGSLRDRILRQYMLKETELEVSRNQFLMLQSLAPIIQGNQNQSGEWVKSIQKSWKEYLGLVFNIEVTKEVEEEQQLKEYYERVVSKLKPVIKKDRKTGKLEVSGLDQMRK